MGYLKINHDLFQDTAFSVWVQSYRTPEFTLFMKFISLWGNLYVGVLSVSLLALYLYRHKKVNSAILILCTLFASLLGSLLKWWVDRPRPTGKELEMVTNLQDQSFPSNHAIHYTVFFGLIMYFIERKIIKLKPQWHDKDLKKGAIKVVMTSSSSDGPEIARHHTSKEDRRALADRMRDPDDELKLVIVRDMWLTGFDVPCLHTLYLDKPMKGHNLMQAIARVNRVYKNKPGGLIRKDFEALKTL
jgi:membrane protein YqaA with SNARE-associated domain